MIERGALVVHQFSLKLVVALLCILCTSGLAAEFGPGEAAARSHAVRADFKVLVWYRRADPLATFKYVVYDVRKENTRRPPNRGSRTCNRNTRHTSRLGVTCTSTARKEIPTCSRSVRSSSAS